MLCSVKCNVSLVFSLFCKNSISKVFAALIEDGTYDWTDEELAMLASQNLINTFRFCNSHVTKNSLIYGRLTLPKTDEFSEKFQTGKLPKKNPFFLDLPTARSQSRPKDPKVGSQLLVPV